MKRLTLAYPFDRMSGKLGIKQDLRYAENDNKAYESPEGKTNYARNYKPVMVAAHVAKTGLQYFAIKTKSAFANTAAARLLCALMGAASAIYGWVIKQTAILSQLNQQYAQAVGGGYDGTFHKWLSAGIRAALQAKAEVIAIAGPTATVTLGNNPFSSAAEAITISTKILVKFWKQLAPNGITFTVDGQTGVAVADDDMETAITVPRINVLGLSIDRIQDVGYIKMGALYVLNPDGRYCVSSDVLYDGEVFTTTDVAPNA